MDENLTGVWKGASGQLQGEPKVSKYCPLSSASVFNNKRLGWHNRMTTGLQRGSSGRPLALPLSWCSHEGGAGTCELIPAVVAPLFASFALQ